MPIINAKYEKHMCPVCLLSVSLLMLLVELALGCHMIVLDTVGQITLQCLWDGWVVGWWGGCASD